MIDQFVLARTRATPLIAIRTPDPQVTVATIMERFADSTAVSSKVYERYKDAPALIWDCIRGIVGINSPGQAYRESKLGGDDTTNAVAALEAAAKFPDRTLFFLSNAHRGLEPTVNPNWVQAVWNLRESYRRGGQTLVLLCPDITLPAELAQDVMIIDEPLPNPEQLEAIIRRTLVDAKVVLEDHDSKVSNAVDATCGLAAFPTEQVTAMSLRRDKNTDSIELNLEDMWERKRQVIRGTPGLSVWSGKQNFESIGGYDNIKGFLKRIVAGKRKPRCVVFMDEIEKSFAGATGGTADSSGVTQGFLGNLLSYMQDTDASGTILIGPPGTVKSDMAKAMGNEAGVPTIVFDLSGMKASLVGESEARLRNALRVVTAVSQGRAFFVATCNRIASLPPELRRRFKSGTFFFDLPNAAERDLIWNIYLNKYGLPLESPRPDSTDWTGAEIKQCCYLAAEELGCTLQEAANFIVPVAKSAEREIAELRAQANGRFISASQPGFYRHEGVATAQGAGRAIAAIED